MLCPGLRPSRPWELARGAQTTNRIAYRTDVAAPGSGAKATCRIEFSRSADWRQAGEARAPILFPRLTTLRRPWFNWQWTTAQRPLRSLRQCWSLLGSGHWVGTYFRPAWARSGNITRRL